MLEWFSRFALVMAIASGCVRAPSPLDVSALVRAHGEAGARGDLEVRILDDPRDVQARLALAKLADQAKRPSQAIEQLEAVLRLGGPLGTRWHADDRARFARLLMARGKARLARESATAFADLQRARSFGAEVDDITLARARSYVAIDQLRHVDNRTRAAGLKVLAELRQMPFADRSWVGALPDAPPRDHGLFGVWLWSQGAKRAAYDALAVWRATTAERDAAKSELHASYLRALAWWTPSEGALPPTAELVGPGRCWFASDCSAAQILDEKDAARRDESVAALDGGPLAATTDGHDAAAWAAITLEQALFDGDGWGRRLAQRVNIEALDLAKVPAFARPVFARLAGSSAPGVPDGALAELAPWQRLVVAAERVLTGASRAQVEVALGDAVNTPEGQALVAMVAKAAPSSLAKPYDDAIVAYLGARGAMPVDDDARAAMIAMAIIDAYRRDPAIADRLARDVVASAPDAAVAYATLGALWSVLDDPARARAAWEAAVDSSPEPAFLRGLADALARAGDPDAALVQGTAAAAAAGDPAPVWAALSRVLAGVGSGHHALEAARSAIDLAGRDSLPEALDAAIVASRAMGRTEQANALAVRRARLAPPPSEAGNVDAQVVLRAVTDPTDAVAAIAAYQRRPMVIAIARMWIASRWNPRDVAIRAALLDAIAPDDPRRTLLVAELVALAGSIDADRGRAAIRALR